MLLFLQMAENSSFVCVIQRKKKKNSWDAWKWAPCSHAGTQSEFQSYLEILFIGHKVHKMARGTPCPFFIFQPEMGCPDNSCKERTLDKNNGDLNLISDSLLIISRFYFLKPIWKVGRVDMSHNSWTAESKTESHLKVSALQGKYQGQQSISIIDIFILVWQILMPIKVLIKLQKEFL